MITVMLYLIRRIGSSVETISLVVAGGVFLLVGCVNEVYTNRSPIIPKRLFKVTLSNIGSSFSNLGRREQQRSYLLPTLSMLWLFSQVRAIKKCLFLAVIWWYLGVYYLPFYYQVLGASATMAGVQ